jgi:hypothetical protein
MAVRFVKLVLNVMMPNYGDFVDEIQAILAALLMLAASGIPLKCGKHLPNYTTSHSTRHSSELPT